MDIKVKGNILTARTNKLFKTKKDDGTIDKKYKVVKSSFNISVCKSAYKTQTEFIKSHPLLLDEELKVIWKAISGTTTEATKGTE